jgi:CubicO group peptidase (beta-lactamase class C family)
MFFSLKIDELMRQGVEEGVFPGAVLLAALGEKVLIHEAYGYAVLNPQKEPAHLSTVYDLASLTKPLATSLAVMALIQEGKLRLDQTLSSLGQGFIFPGKEAITVRQLLAHSSGFPAYRPYYLPYSPEQTIDKGRLRSQVGQEALSYPPGCGTLYSDLGFIILEGIIEDLSGQDLDLWTRENLYKPLGLARLGFRPRMGAGPVEAEAYAATEYCPWRKKIIRGEVHDENSFVVGGISGQAGLFGRAIDVFHLLRSLKKVYDDPQGSGLFEGPLVRAFWQKQEEPAGTTRALGFDTPAERESMAGRYFSGRSIGHLGFTGTSFWLDLETDLMVVLLSNRIHPSRTNEKIKLFRPLIHDLIFTEVFQMEKL